MKPPRNLWPLAISLTFVIFLSGTVGLVVLASAQRVDLVSANYYAQELKYQNQIDRLQHARRLPVPATIAYDPARKRICVSLPLPDPNPNLAPARSSDVSPSPHARRPITGTLQLYRPSEAALDRELKLEPDLNGRQFVDASSLRPGLWKIRVTWSADNQEYFADQQLVIKASP